MLLNALQGVGSWAMSCGLATVDLVKQTCTSAGDVLLSAGNVIMKLAGQM